MKHLLAPLVLLVLFPGLLQAQFQNPSRKLLASDATGDRQFGSTVAVDGTRVLVGALRDEENGPGAGAAYLLDALTEVELFKFLPGDGQSGDRFGAAAALDGGFALLGAWSEDTLGTQAGAAYLFDTNTGAELHKLLPTDGSSADNFGFSVALGGNRALVGAPGHDAGGSNVGAVYVFDTATGLQIDKLLPGDGGSQDNFGSSVAVSGDLAVVGAWLHDGGSKDTGAAYVFDLTTGTQLHKLQPADRQANDLLGIAVDLDGVLAVLGAYGDDDLGGSAGSAYVFHAPTGTELRKLTADDGDAADFFGWTVGISGDRAVVGAFFDEPFGPNSGSAYLFDVTTGNQLTKLLPDDGASGDTFGMSVSIDGDVLAAGSARDDDAGPDSGAVYVFDVCSELAEAVLDNGSGANPQTLSASGTPRFGSDLVLTLDCTGQAPSVGVVFGYSQPAPVPLTLAIGELLIDPGSAPRVQQVKPHGGGAVDFSFAVPPDPLFCGGRLYVQGACFGTPGTQLTNRVDLRAGY